MSTDPFQTVSALMRADVARHENETPSRPRAQAPTCCGPAHTKAGKPGPPSAPATARRTSTLRRVWGAVFR